MNNIRTTASRLFIVAWLFWELVVLCSQLYEKDYAWLWYTITKVVVLSWLCSCMTRKRVSLSPKVAGQMCAFKSIKIHAVIKNKWVQYCCVSILGLVFLFVAWDWHQEDLNWPFVCVLILGLILNAMASVFVVKGIKKAFQGR